MTKIDVFSGFLGAGKTTLIKKLIKEAYNGEKVAQGREKMRIYLKENPAVAKEIEEKIRAAAKGVIIEEGEDEE